MRFGRRPPAGSRGNKYLKLFLFFSCCELKIRSVIKKVNLLKKCQFYLRIVRRKQIRQNLAVIVFRTVYCATKMIMCLYLFIMFFKACNYMGFVHARPSTSLRNQAGLAKDIVFPSSQEIDGDLYISLPPQCSNQTFCENTVNYPTKLFNSMLESATYGNRYQQYFETLAYNEQLIYNRKNEKSEYFICPSRKSVVFPRVAFNTKKELKFIYNLDSYKQGVTIDTCVKKSKCKFYDEIKNLQTRCKQLFVEKLLLTADSNGRPYVDRYKFPSACVCAYRSEINHARFSRLYKYK